MPRLGLPGQKSARASVQADSQWEGRAKFHKIPCRLLPFASNFCLSASIGCMQNASQVKTAAIKWGTYSYWDGTKRGLEKGMA